MGPESVESQQESNKDALRDWELTSSTSSENVWSHVGLRLLSMVRVRTTRPSRMDNCRSRNAQGCRGRWLATGRVHSATPQQLLLARHDWDVRRRSNSYLCMARGAVQLLCACTCQAGVMASHRLLVRMQRRSVNRTNLPFWLQLGAALKNTF